MTGLLSAVDGERDAYLLDGHRGGDAAAFGELYSRHYDRLLRHVRQRVRDWHLAEEITQDAFVRAYGAAVHLKDGTRFYPWLTVVAQRLAIDYFRRTGRVSPVANLAGEVGAEPAADEELIAACEHHAVEAALGRVRERHRQVLRWQTEGLTYEDIAQRLNTPLTTVPPLLFRARQALKREYLAVTEPERIAAVPLLGTLGLALRRWTSRGTQLAAWVPEPAVLTAQFASFVLVVGVALGVGATGVQLERNGIASNGSDPRARAPVAPEAAIAPHGDSAQTHRDAPIEKPGGRPPVKRALPGFGIDQHGADQARAQARRESPYFVEFGDTWIAVDPEGDTRHMQDVIQQGMRVP